eukprot:6490793-Amphidinium_carterae.2
MSGSLALLTYGPTCKRGVIRRGRQREAEMPQPVQVGWGQFPPGSVCVCNNGNSLPFRRARGVWGLGVEVHPLVEVTME